MIVRDDTRCIQESTYDVIIAGGGLAGLSLARQLTRGNRDLSVLVIEKLSRPLPAAAFKVGESSVEAAAYYFAKILGLGDYLREEHLLKLGLRFFFPGARDDFAARPEFGVAQSPPADSFQLDRGRLENHMRGLIIEDGVILKEGATVRDIVLHDDPELHEVVYKEGDAAIQTARARWVVDATGRRRLLQRKLGLGKRSRNVLSSAWFRVSGKVDVDQFVPASNTGWRNRVRDKRWLSTNHLMGKGYWVWLIPLAPDNTSIGIVTDESIHPFTEYNTHEKAIAWLDRYEPIVVEHLENHEVLDFRTMKDYSYSSHQVFSENRWSCVGEAGMFIDPYYSIGSNMIAFSNGFTQKMIELDLAGEPTKEFVDHANLFYLSITETLTHNIQLAYRFYDHPQVMALKTMWDFCVGWSIADPQLYYETYLDVKLSNVLSNLIARVVVTQARMMELFTRWSQKAPEAFDFEFDYIDYVEHVPTIHSFLIDNLPKENMTAGKILADFRRTVERLEEVAHVIFFMAVEDITPEKLSLFEGRRWINTQAISLDPDRWEADGLFEPKAAPRDLTAMDSEIRSLFQAKKEAAPA